MPPPSRYPLLALTTAAVVFSALSSIPLLVRAEGSTRSITVANECTYTVWPALFTQTADFVPTQATGWEAASGTNVTFTVDEGWARRIWGRNDCDFTQDVPEYEMCATGGCIGGLVCTETGVPPANLAEFNLQEGQDNYDSSNVDGFNIPMAITNTGDCPLSNCPYNLLATCPSSLQVTNDDGDVVGCYTDCGATGDDEYCCAGDYATPDTCPSSNIPNYAWWKASCPVSYAYAYDESSGTALFTCESRPDWAITFCPDSTLFDTTVTLPNGSTTTQGGDSVSTADSVSITGSGSGGGTAAATTTAAGDTASAGSDTTATATATATGTTTAAAAGTTTAAAAAGTTTSKATSASSSSSKASTSSTKAATTSSSSASTASGTSTSSSSSDDDDDDDDDDDSTSSSLSTILGLPSTAFYAIIAVVAVLLIGGAMFYFYSQGKKKNDDDDGDEAGGRRHRRGRGRDSDDSSGSDSDSSSSGGDEEDRSLAKRSYRSVDAAQEGEMKLYAAAAKDPGGLAGVLGASRGVRKEGSRRSSGRRTGRRGSIVDEAAEENERAGLRSRRSSEDDWV